MGSFDGTGLRFTCYCLWRLVGCFIERVLQTQDSTGTGATFLFLLFLVSLWICVGLSRRGRLVLLCLTRCCWWTRASMAFLRFGGWRVWASIFAFVWLTC